MKRLLRKSGPIAIATVLALGAAACGGDSEPAAQDTTEAETSSPATTAEETSEPQTTEPETDDEQASADPYAELRESDRQIVEASTALATGIAAAAGMEGDPASPVAELRTSLTELLQEHVYFAGLAVDAAYSFGPETPQFDAAAAALDENSVALADLVGSVAPDERDAFLELWRNHIGFFVNYAKGVKGGDQAMVDEALSNLEQYRQQSAAFFNEVSGGVIAEEDVKATLQEHVNTLTAAIDAFAEGSGDAFDKLKAAADHMDMSAKALAAGISEAAGLEGDPNSAASEARAALTGLLQEHVILAGIGVKTAYAAGLDSPEFEAATATLDTNSVELSELVGSVAGEEKGDQFLELWRNHIGFFVNYAKGAAGGDDELKQQALDNLAQYREQSSAFFEEITGGELPADAVKAELEGHVETLTSAIDALAAALV